MGRVDAAMRRAEAARAGTPEAALATALADAPPDVTRPPEPAAPRSAPQVIFEHLDATLAGKIVVDAQTSAPAREQYRRLAATLHHAQAANGLKVVMIASAVPGEGKTLTAANLALTLSESYDRRVLLIDADLRRPSLDRLFHLTGSPGLTENLLAAEDRPLALHAISANLSVLPAGKASVDPMAGLASPRMRHILGEAREAFDWVIVDTPPVGLLSDASLLAANVDTTIFVVKAESTPYDLVKRAIDNIGADRLLGVVMNCAAPQVHRYGYGYKYHAGYHPAEDGTAHPR